MNKAFPERYRDLVRVVGQLQEALAMPVNPIVRDSAILRFELGFEVAWKCLQVAVRHQGLEANSPRQAFEQAFRLGWIRDELLWKELLDARNMAVHVYREELANRLFAGLPRFAGAYAELAASLHELL